MTIHAATPYLSLAGRAQEAIALYERALGARVADLKRFGDVDGSCPASSRDRIMHAELRIGDAVLMLSDATTNDAPSERGPISVALHLDDEKEARHAFETLASGGKVIEALTPAPWGALFGALTDAFGVPWMFNVTR